MSPAATVTKSQIEIAVISSRTAVRFLTTWFLGYPMVFIAECYGEGQCHDALECIHLSLFSLFPRVESSHRRLFYAAALHWRHWKKAFSLRIVSSPSAWAWWRREIVVLRKWGADQSASDALYPMRPPVYLTRCLTALTHPKSKEKKSTKY